MSDATRTRNQIGIDKALQYAVTFAWEEFQTIRPRSVRVEYLCEPGAALNHLSVWSARAGGYQDLVFDYATWSSSSQPDGARFADGRPEGLAQTLDFIMQHQNQFTRPSDAGRHGLVLIYPPQGDDRSEAATWIRGIDTPPNEASGGEATARRPPKQSLNDQKPTGKTESSKRRRKELSKRAPEIPPQQYPMPPDTAEANRPRRRQKRAPRIILHRGMRGLSRS